MRACFEAIHRLRTRPCTPPFAHLPHAPPLTPSTAFSQARLFEAIDADGSGALDPHELRAALGPKAGGSEAFAWLDGGQHGVTGGARDGLLSRDEFVRQFESLAQPVQLFLMNPT